MLLFSITDAMLQRLQSDPDPVFLTHFSAATIHHNPAGVNPQPCAFSDSQAELCFQHFQFRTSACCLLIVEELSENCVCAF